MVNEIKKYLKFRTVLDKFVLVIQFYIIFALISLIDFDLKDWWLPSTNPDVYRAFIVVFSIFLVDIAFFTLNFYFFKIKGINLLNVGLTGAFTYLVVHPLMNPIWLPAFCAFIAIVARFFIRIKNNSKPLFNPAAQGMILTYLISIIFVELGLLKGKLFISWWAADFGPELSLGKFNISIHWIIFLPIFAYFLNRFRRNTYAISSLLSILFFQIINLLLLEKLNFTSILISLSFGLGTWLFMSFLMLVDPKTSPIFPKQQMIVGSVAGLVYVLLLKIESLPAHEILTILIMNLITLGLAEYYTKKRNMKSKPTGI